MKGFLVQAAAAVLISAPLTAYEGAPFHAFLYEEGQSWVAQDTLLIRLPDPRTGFSYPMVTRGLFRYTVEAVDPSGAALVLLETDKISSGTSGKDLKPLALLPDQRTAQYLLMTREGYIYGPLSREAGQRLKKEGTRETWSSQRGEPWIWHKLPLEPIPVGASATRQLGAERWIITRLPDAKVSRVRCSVYQARLESGRARVTETLWFAADAGYAVKRVVLEDRGESATSELTQAREL